MLTPRYNLRRQLTLDTNDQMLAIILSTLAGFVLLSCMVYAYRHRLYNICHKKPDETLTTNSEPISSNNVQQPKASVDGFEEVYLGNGSPPPMLTANV